MIDDKTLLKFDGPVPRYTSYPTAPHFTDAIGSEMYRQWLGEIPGHEPLSLYFHVPFCDTLCWFCGCQMTVVNRYEPVASYLDVLDMEIDRVAEALHTRRPVRHLHWGGGSPTIVASDDFKKVMAHIGQNFDILDDAEIAVEIDPRGFTAVHARALAEAGVNRASIGIQDFDPAVQAAVNRLQPFNETKAVVESLREHDISGISFDLLYGLPHQNVQTMISTVDLAVSLDPARLSLFGYAHVPWMRPHQALIPDELLPDGRARLALYRAAAGRLAEHGYVPIGIDHFARPDDAMAQAIDDGRLRRNFQGYTTDEADTLIGFGASAIGSLPQGYVQNAPLVPDYRSAIEGGGLAIAKGIAIDDGDRLRRAVIERLMCDLSVDLADEARRYDLDVDLFRPSLDNLLPLQSEGLVTVDGNIVTVPEAARLSVRVVCAAFDSYLGQGPGRHSRAV